MTDEIIKLYENAGIERTHYDACTLEDKYWKDGSMQNLYGTFDSYLSFECPHYGEGCYSTCEYAYDKDEYPSFTAEKLIKLEMFLINKGDFDIKKGSVDITFESFTSCIAGLINNIWQDLSEEEKQQVKGILE